MNNKFTVQQIIAEAYETIKDAIGIIESEWPDTYKKGRATLRRLDEATNITQNHSEQDLNMVQEPVAYVTGTYGGRFVVEPINRAMVLPTGMAFYTAPPTAAIAASRMRDAAVGVCDRAGRAITIEVVKACIAALPIPGEEK